MILNCSSFILGLALFSRLCYAQVVSSFQWSFADSSQQISTDLTECANLKIRLIAKNNSIGPPPYYVMAFEPGGFSTTSFVGTNSTDLTWQVNHAAGTQLMLSMADGNRNAGGIPNNMFTVVPGQNSSCLPSTPTTNLAITTNVTKDLETCDRWGLTVTGGTPPYNITLAALGSPLVTNVTLASGYDVLTYIDRADPNGHILAAVSDSTGQFGNTTVLVNTIGSTDVSCAGLVSRAGNSTEISAANAKAKSDSKKSKRRTTIIAACVTIGGLIVIGVVIFALYLRRKKKIARGIQDGQDTLARVFKEDTIDSPESFTQPPPQSPRKQPMITLADTSPSTTASGSVLPPPGIVVSNSQDPSSPQYAQVFPSDSTSQDHGSPAAGSTNVSNPTTPNTPLSPNSFDSSGRHVKTRTRSTRSNDNLRRPGSSHPSNSSRVPLPSRPFTAGSQPLDPDTEPDIIIQHRDGGIVQELPPPYLDHRDRDRNQQPLPPVPSDSDPDHAGDAASAGNVAGGSSADDTRNTEVPNSAEGS